MAFAFRLSREKGFLPLDQIHGALKFQKIWARKASLFNDPAGRLGAFELSGCSILYSARKPLICHGSKSAALDFARQWHHIAFMTSTKTRGQKQGAQLTRALARWEGEGGAPQPKSESNRETRAALAREEEQFLRCVGAAVIMQWNDLPTKIQRDLFDHAISMGEPRYTAQLKERIARFLHRHKNDAHGK